METKRSSLDLFLIFLLLALAVLLVEERWLRAGVTILPTLLLVQRASTFAPPETAAAAVRGANNTESDVKGYIDEVQKQIRDLYATCHLMSGGGLEPEAARERTSRIERELDLLLARLSGGSKA